MWADKLKDEAARAEAQEAADRFTSAMTTETDVLLEQVLAARQGAVPPAGRYGSCPGIRGNLDLDAGCLCSFILLRLADVDAGRSGSFRNVCVASCKANRTCVCPSDSCWQPLPESVSACIRHNDKKKTP